MSKKLVMIANKKLKGKSRCADCMAIKWFFDKIKHRGELEIIVSIFNWLNLIKHTMITYCAKCRKKTENLNSKIS